MHDSVKFSLSSVYHAVYASNRGLGMFIHVHNGYVMNRPVPLKIDDLNLMDDLHTVLTFYLNVELHMVQIPGPYSVINDEYVDEYADEYVDEYVDKYAGDFHLGPCHTCCKICGAYKDEPYIYTKSHEIVCCKCENWNYEKGVTFTKPVINFNMYEWIPIKHNILENRNPRSDLYMRRLYVERRDENEKIALRLMKSDQPVNDAIFQTMDCYNLPDVVVNDILGQLNCSGSGNNTKKRPKQELKTVIITN